MKDEIIKIIETSQNGYELADRICELIEEEKDQERKIVKKAIYDWICDNGGYTSAGAFRRWNTDELSLHELANDIHFTPATPEDSRRDGGKGK